MAPKTDDEAVRAVIALGKSRGYLTYEEMNEQLPDDADPEKLASLLMTLDEMGIELIDEAELDAREKFSDGTDTDGNKNGKARGKDPAEGLDGDRGRIDDPVRMYLTQMGEIPLLTRPEEIALAKKIEMTRMHFRRRVLESDYCAAQAADILHEVSEGNLPFDRTMKISSAENLAKDTIGKRIPVNLQTARGALEANRREWDEVAQSRAAAARRRDAQRRMWRRRRRIAKLLEELSLRTSRIQPLMKKLLHISKKMDELPAEPMAA